MNPNDTDDGWDEKQSETWHALFDRVHAILNRNGVENPYAEEDYWINYDNYGWTRITFAATKLRMLEPRIVAELRALLTDLPDWEIVAVVDILDKDGVWPKMGLTIRKHEIVDGLQRQLFPEPYRSFQYPGSRAGTGFD